MPPPPPPPYLHPQYPRPDYLGGTTAHGSMRIDFRTPRIEAYAGGTSARLVSSFNFWHPFETIRFRPVI